MRKSAWFFVLLLAVTIVNYPNPFNPKGGEVTTFECTASTALDTTLYIYDMAARLVLHKDVALTAGASRTTWDGYTDWNERAGNGVYLYRLVDRGAKTSLGKGKVWVVNH